MDDSDILVLSGRTFVTRIPFASPDVLRTAVSDGAMTDDGRQPMLGDLRISATISNETRSSAHAKSPCDGSLSMSIFDGACWQRFEIASLTNMYKFASEVQLRGVLGWTNRAARDAQGRQCRRAVGANVFPVYELLPLAVSASPVSVVVLAGDQKKAPSSRTSD